MGDMEVEPLEIQFKGRQETWQSGVKIRKCRYLEVSGCKAMCVNMWCAFSLVVNWVASTLF